MAYDKLRLYRKFIAVLIQYGVIFLYQRVQAVIHKRTYREGPSLKNVVVLGGSFAGISLAKRLTETLPTGYRVVLVEKNSHFNYVFNFPRYSVLQGHEQRAFVPYAGLAKDAPKGIFELVQDQVTNIGDGEVELKSGGRITFEYLAIATGTRQNPPAQVKSTEKKDGCNELEEMQAKIKAAKNIAIVGGGPVGVQLAADIKTFYENKRVVLIHSRASSSQVLERDSMKRPQRPSVAKPMSLQFKGGGRDYFDLVIPCTGQSPNSSILAQLGGQAICPRTQRVLVNPTLQVHFSDQPTSKQSKIFALGDVAETGGPKMGRAGLIQAEIVRANIVSLIKNTKLETYVPIPLEGILKLSLGKAECVLYLNGEEGDDILVPMKSQKEDL